MTFHFTVLLCNIAWFGSYRIALLGWILWLVRGCENSPPIFEKMAERQTVGGRRAEAGNSKPRKPFSPTQYSTPEMWQLYDSYSNPSRFILGEPRFSLKPRRDSSLALILCWRNPPFCTFKASNDFWLKWQNDHELWRANGINVFNCSCIPPGRGCNENAGNTHLSYYDVGVISLRNICLRNPCHTFLVKGLWGHCLRVHFKEK